MLSDEGEIVKTKGEPMDVPVNSWIDVLDMPDDSAFNQMMNHRIFSHVHRTSIGFCFDGISPSSTLTNVFSAGINRRDPQNLRREFSFANIPC
ncbi:hypothetical protein [Enterobacter hormaechei]|uniref:hypothetical protein n=1 Tax=Enterobacter hormaechei TaxID=158836 RepID=UPI00388FC45F